MSDNSDPWFNAARESLASSQAAQISNNLQFSLDANPQKEASIRQLYNTTGIPIDAIRDNEQAVRTAATLRQFDANGLVIGAPVTARLMTDQNNTRLLHDAIPNTMAVEKATAAPPATIGDTISRGLHGFANWLGSSATELGHGAAEWTNKAAGNVNLVLGGIPVIADKIAGTNSADWWFENMVKPRMDQAEAYELKPDASFNDKLMHGIGAFAPMIASIFGSGGTAAVPEGVAATAEGAQILPALGKAVQHAIQTMWFPAVNDAVSTGHKVFEATGDGQKALAAAQAQYVASTGMGIIPLSVAGSTVTRAASGFAGQVAAGEASRQFMNSALPDSMHADFNWEDAFVNGTIGSLMGTALGPRAGGIDTSAVRKTYIDAAKSDAAVADYDRLNMVSKMSSASALRERDPALFKRFVSEVTEGQGTPDLYIDAHELGGALDRAGITADELQRSMPDLAAQLPEAQATKGMVRIPMADYATHIAGTEIDQAILPHVRTDPEGMTYQEGQAFHQSQLEQMQAAAAHEVSARLADGNRIESKQRVEDDVKQQLMATGRVSEDVASTYAALHGNFFDTMAEKLGVSPDAAYRELGGARIVGEAASATDAKPSASLSQEPGSAHATISGDEFGPAGTPTADLRAAAKTWYNDTLRGTSVTNQDSGKEVHFSNGKKALSTSADPTKVKLFAALPELIKNGTIEKTSEPVDRSLEPAVRAYHWLTGDVNIGGELHRVGVTIREDDKGNLFYNHNPVKEGGSASPETRATPANKAGGLPSGEETLDQKVAPQTGDVNLHILGQGEVKRGSYEPNTRTLALLKNADLSTFVHESGHFFLDTYQRVAGGEGAPASVKADFDALLQSFGIEGDTPEARLDNWSARDLDGQRAGHEQFAQAFEKYLMEGKAPSSELAGLFARFRSWLLSVYKSVASLRADLSPEVREVMDRMLASEETIKATEASRSFEPLFHSAEGTGMTHAEWEDYLSLGQDATQHAVDELQGRAIRDLKWMAEAKDRTIRAMQQDAARRRTTIRDGVIRDMDKEPVERARNSLASGKMVDRDGQPAQGTAHDGVELKLNKAAVRDLYPNDMPNRPDIDRLSPYSAADGMHPDMLAEMFEFPSGRDLVDALLGAGDREAKIDAMTDQRMLERYGDLATPEAINEAAELAIRNDIRARMIATELKVAAKADGSPTAIARAAREAAERAIASKPVGDIRPGMYSAAETRAARNAIKALHAEDISAVADEKRAQLLNNRLAKAASDAEFEVENGRRYLKKFNKASVAQKLGANYMDRILGLLEQFGLAPRAPDAVVPLRDWAHAEFERTGTMPMIADSLIDQRVNWDRLSLSDFRSLIESVKSIEHVAREQGILTLDGKRVELDSLVDEAKQSMSTLKHADPVDLKPHLQHARGIDKISTKFLNLKSKLRSADAALLKMEQLFQWFDAGSRSGLADDRIGAFAKIFKRISQAEAHERSLRSESVAALRDLGDKLREAGINTDETLAVELERPGRGTQWYREELLAAALNTGNESNMQKLTQGYGWSEAQVRSALDAHLSKAEWDFVQGVWDAVGKHGPQIEALQRRQTGVSPAMIEPRTVRTKHGDYTGGYYPVVFDAFQDRNAETKLARQADMLFENQWAKPTTNKGHTVERTGYVGPLHLSLSVISRHLDQISHDLAYREAIIDANKFLNDSRIKSEIDQTFGREYTQQLRPWLQAIANDKVFNTSGDSAWENFYRKARSNVTIMGLGYRFSTMQIHGLSALSTSFGEVGTKWMAKGIAQFMGPDRWQNARDFVFDRSPEMLNRSNEFDRNVAEAINEINAHKSSFKPINALQETVDGAKKFAFYGVAMLDMASAMPTWYGAYLKGMAPHGEGGLNMSEEAAVEYANRAVRNAHGGGGAKDLAAIQRDKGAMSMATMFYSFWNHMYNRQRDLFKGYSNLGESVSGGHGTRDFARLLARSWWYFVVPQLVHAMLKPSGDKNDDGSLSHMLLHMAEEVAVGAISGVPVLRDLANAAVNGRSYTVTPLESAGKALVTTASDTAKVAHGEPAPPHMAKNAIQSVGYVYGLPLGQASTSGQFLWDVVNGQQNPQDLADWWRGIQHGDMNRR